VCGAGLTGPLAGAVVGSAVEGTAVGGAAAGDGPVNGGAEPSGPWVDIPPYQGDVLVRGSEALAKTRDGRLARDVI